MSITYAQKVIYNNYLRASRSNKGKAWRPRKDFSKLPGVEQKHLQRIENILITSNVPVENYFDAPYKLYEGEDTYYDLKFFASFKAIRVYYQWWNKLMFLEPDSDVIKERVKEGFQHIFNTCREHNLGSIEEYFRLKTYYPEFLVALSERKITFFNILAIDNHEKILKQIPKEDVDFIVPDFYNTIESLRARYYQTKLKTINQEVIKKLNKVLKNKER